MKKSSFVITAAIAAFMFTACSENTQQENTTAHTEEQVDTEDEAVTNNEVIETPDFSTVAEPVKTQISQLVDEYLKLKEALVASDANAAKEAANSVLTVANAMPIATLTTDEKAYAEERVAEVKESATKIAEASDLAAQRQNLEKLSEATFSLVKAYGVDKGTLYYQHCPMALNNQGAYWLSNQKEIRNPYFGESMLKCGSTEEVLN